LRQVTRDDVVAQLEPLTGNTRDKTLVVLRSLFATSKKAGVVFRNVHIEPVDLDRAHERVDVAPHVDPQRLEPAIRPFH
jgi:hypothetical protein